MPELYLAGKKVNYMMAGISPATAPATLVFIHGAGGGCRQWWYQVHGLGETVAMIAVDLPGHGGSAGPGMSRIDDYAAWLGDLIRELGLSRIIPVGHSMGGAIAMTLALQQPELLQKLVLVGTGSRLRVAAQILDSFNGATTDPAFLKAAYSPATPAKLVELGLKEYATNPPEICRGDFEACDVFDVTNRLAEIKATTLVICGRDDLLTPVKYSEFLTQRLPAAQLEIIDNSGHMLMLEQPEAFNRVLRDFIVD